MKISADSQYALINRASEHGPAAVCVRCFRSAIPFNARSRARSQEIHLLDLATQQVVRKYSGHSQSKHVIRSCFGGVDGNFVVSGSEGASRPFALSNCCVSAG